jgi:hypothetical protein
MAKRIGLKDIAELKRRIAAASPSQRRVLEARLQTLRAAFNAQARARNPPSAPVEEPEADDDDDGDGDHDDVGNDDEGPEDAKKKTKRAQPAPKPAERYWPADAAEARHEIERLDGSIRRLELARGIPSPVEPFTQAALVAYAKAHSVSLDVAIVHMSAGRR